MKKTMAEILSDLHDKNSESKCESMKIINCKYSDPKKEEIADAARHVIALMNIEIVDLKNRIRKLENNNFMGM